jgi:hypothetical protein
MIRFATRYDNDAIINMMKQFAIDAKYPMAKNPMGWSKTHIEKTLNELHAGRGFVFIDSNYTGILIAVRTQSFWIPDFIQLQEVMLHGKNKFIIGRLIHKYKELAKELKQQGKINEAVMFSNNDCDYTGLDMIKFESIWRVA